MVMSSTINVLTNIFPTEQNLSNIRLHEQSLKHYKDYLEKSTPGIRFRAFTLKAVDETIVIIL